MVSAAEDCDSAGLRRCKASCGTVSRMLYYCLSASHRISYRCGNQVGLPSSLWVTRGRCLDEKAVTNITLKQRCFWLLIEHQERERGGKLLTDTSIHLRIVLSSFGELLIYRTPIQKNNPALFLQSTTTKENGSLIIASTGRRWCTSRVATTTTSRFNEHVQWKEYESWRLFDR